MARTERQSCPAPGHKGLHGPAQGLRAESKQQDPILQGLQSGRTDGGQQALALTPECTCHLSPCTHHMEPELLWSLSGLLPRARAGRSSYHQTPARPLPVGHDGVGMGPCESPAGAGPASF